MSRIVCQFSCGAASAVTTKLAIAEYGDSVVIVNAFIKNEDADNRRFLADCEKWFGRAITVLRDEKYDADINVVFRRVSYIKGSQAAACTSRIKRGLLKSFEQPGDVLVLGYTADEKWRYDDWPDNWPDRQILAPLLERGLTKEDCKAMVERAGIVLPMQYRRGYKNANCQTFVRGGLGYFRAVREDFPEEFEELCVSEDHVAALHGEQARILRHRSGPLKGQRFPLHELPIGPADRNDAPPERGLFCESAEQEYAA